MLCFVKAASSDFLACDHPAIHIYVIIIYTNVLFVTDL